MDAPGVGHLLSNPHFHPTIDAFPFSLIIHLMAGQDGGVSRHMPPHPPPPYDIMHTHKTGTTPPEFWKPS